VLCGDSLHLALAFQGAMGDFQGQSKKGVSSAVCVQESRSSWENEVCGLYVKNAYIAPVR